MWCTTDLSGELKERIKLWVLVRCGGLGGWKDDRPSIFSGDYDITSSSSIVAVKGVVVLAEIQIQWGLEIQV